MMMKMKHLLCLLFLPCFVGNAFAAFPDVADRSLSKTAIEYLEAQNLVQGYADGTFRPDNHINRAEFLKIVLGARFGPDLSTNKTPALPDVAKDQWFAPYVFKALEEHIVSGYPDGFFRPERSINLAEALKIVELAFNIPLPQYFRAPDHWYDPYFDAAGSALLLARVASNDPAYTITRGDTATIVHAALDPSIPPVSLSEILDVVDGDTVKILYNGTEETVRLIGIDTPETVHPTKPAQCFGAEASARTKELLTGKRVAVELDSSQGERDKYGRLLAYLFLTNGTNVAEELILEGYGKEYTYDQPYNYMMEFRQAEERARTSGTGLWAAATCGGNTESSAITASSQSDSMGTCTIKGNITAEGEKIYHTAVCSSYAKTVITETKGEQWFCSEAEAVAAGWRKAMNCL